MFVNGVVSLHYFSLSLRKQILNLDLHLSLVTGSRFSEIEKQNNVIELARVVREFGELI
jgi:hypothetical protein